MDTGRLFSVADRSIRIAGGTLCRLLSHFESSCPDEEPICTIAESVCAAQYDVKYITPTHPIAHVFGLGSDSGAFLMSDETYEHSTVVIQGLLDGSALELLLPAVCSRLAFFRTIFTHAALIDTKDHGGLLFLGRSGVGKTTQAELWAKHRGADILNGDKVFLSLNEAGDAVTAHGNPWHGSSPYCVNRSVPLTGIVTLEQAPENSIRRLDDMEALTEYMTHTFLPVWDSRCTDLVMETIGGMIPLVPVYRLACRPDEDAVALTRRTLYGEAD